MILIDHPRSCAGADRFRRFRRTAHCMSDLTGQAATDELVAFCCGTLGMKREWLQNPGGATEHFDLFDGRVQAALDIGTPSVSGRELVLRCVKPKRAAGQR